MSAKGKRHLERVASLPCVLCKHLGLGVRYGVQVHHIREGQGAAQRADDMLTVAICQDHHLGPNGIHGLGRKGFRLRYNMDELDLLAMTLDALEA